MAPGELTVQLVVKLSHWDLLFLTKCALICYTLHISLVSLIFSPFNAMRGGGVKTGSCETEQSTDSFESIDFSAH